MTSFRVEADAAAEALSIPAATGTPGATEPPLEGPPSRTMRKVRRRVLIIGRRLLRLGLVLWMVSLSTFVLMQVAPGGAAHSILGMDATPEAVARINEQLGLNKPAVTQYKEWMSGVLHGDLGTSLLPPELPVADRIKAAFPISAELAVLALLLAILVSVPVAVWSAYRPGGHLDRISSTASFALLSVPTFVSGLVLALFFCIEVNVFPRSQWVRIGDGDLMAHVSHLFLPVLTLSLPLMAQYVRLLRSDMQQTLQEDYVVAASAKGMSPSYVLFRHALRPSSFSLLTLSAVNLGYLLGGTAIVESIFGLPGLGSLLLKSVDAKDYPMVQGIVLVVAVIFVWLNLLTDLLYSFLDPRTRRAHV